MELSETATDMVEQFNNNVQNFNELFNMRLFSLPDKKNAFIIECKTFSNHE